jgi:hypothetical protein
VQPVCAAPCINSDAQRGLRRGSDASRARALVRYDRGFRARCPFGRHLVLPGNPIDTAREVAKAAGRSNRVVSGLSRAGRVLGPIGLGIGVGLGVREYVNAPPERKAAVAAGETGALIGGAIGFSLGTGAATLALGTALAVSGPVGWAALGAVLLTGAVAGYFGAEWECSLTSGFFE